MDEFAEDLRTMEQTRIYKGLYIKRRRKARRGKIANSTQILENFNWKINIRRNMRIKNEEEITGKFQRNRIVWNFGNNWVGEKERKKISLEQNAWRR